MKTNLVNELKKERKLLLEEMKDIKSSIKKDLEDDILSKVNVCFNSWDKTITISIQPISAWTNVLTLEIGQSSNIFKTLSWGWTIEKNALKEINYVTNKLIKYLEEHNLNEKIKELDKLENEIIKEESTKNLIKIDDNLVEDLLIYVKNTSEVKVYHMFVKKLEKCLVEHTGHYYKLCKKRNSKEDIKDILVRDFYVDNETLNDIKDNIKNNIKKEIK